MMTQNGFSAYIVDIINEIFNSSEENDDFDNSFDDPSSMDEKEFVENDNDIIDADIAIIAVPCYQWSLLINYVMCLIFIWHYFFCDIFLS